MRPQDFIAWRARHGFFQTEAGQVLGKDRKTIYRLEAADPSSELPRETALACAAIDNPSIWRLMPRPETGLEPMLVRAPSEAYSPR